MYIHTYINLNKKKYYFSVSLVYIKLNKNVLLNNYLLQGDRKAHIIYNITLFILGIMRSNKA